MAPRRNHHGGHGGGGHGGHGAAGAAGAGGNGNEVQGFGIDPETIENHDANVTRCCVPTGECLRANNINPGSNSNNTNTDIINLDDLRDAVKVTCNNDHCNVGQYMHRECFDAWEQTVLTYLKSCGRARSWSERQRHQNLWTKKGYDLAFKACGCRCGRGHLKKDLDWMPPPPSNIGFGGRADDNADAKKKKRRNRQNTRPTLALSAHPAYHPNNNNVQGQQNNGLKGGSEAQLISAAGEVRGRTGSLSSSTGSSSPPASGSSEPSVSPVHSGSGNGGKKKSKFEFFSDRSR